MERSTDRATLYGLETAAREGITTIWDRYEAQLPQCNFGSLGVCCRMCLQGPCRIDPFGEGATKGICGATADTIVARNLARFIAGGTAAHSGHAKHLAHTMLKMADGTAPDYSIRDEAKLKAVAARQGVPVDGRPIAEIARDVARAGLLEFSEREEPLAWLATTVTPGRMELFTKLGILPMGIDSTIAEVMHATTYGVDADPVNILLTGLKCSLSDYAGMHLGTDLSDALFGTPTPRASGANLGTLRADSINVAVHGHNPVLSDIICEVAVEMDDEAKAAGAPGGFNLVGVCCTGMEVQMRHGIPWATSSLSQELVITTGALEAIPGELTEAAVMDGAGPWRRFWSITLPLLLVSVAPLLIASFAFNFNNFSLIYMLTGGGPNYPGAPLPIGETDILISMVYAMAFESGTRQYGLASAMSIIIFVVVGVISWLGFRQTRKLEEIM